MPRLQISEFAKSRSLRRAARFLTAAANCSSIRARLSTSCSCTNRSKTINPIDRLENYEAGLALDRQYLLDRLNLIKKQPDFMAMVLKENANSQDIAWVESQQIEYPELRIELQPQQHYPHGKTMAHLLGDVGEISPKELEKPEIIAAGFRPGDIVGKGGLEQFYNQSLRGVPSYRKVLVDSRGRVQDELEIVQPQAG